MAAILPTDLFPNYTSDGTNITIPLADLVGLAAAEADAATGDGREVAWALINTVAEAIIALDSANRPTKMTVNKPTPTGITGGLRQAYTLSFDRSVTTSQTEMQPE